MKQSNKIGELQDELQTIKKDTEAHYENLLTEKDQLIYQSQQRIQELEKNQKESVVESLSVQEDTFDKQSSVHLDTQTEYSDEDKDQVALHKDELEELQQQLEEKNKLIYLQKVEFEELKAQWESERAELVRPALEQVTEQLDELRRTVRCSSE